MYQLNDAGLGDAGGLSMRSGAATGLLISSGPELVEMGACGCAICAGASSAGQPIPLPPQAAEKPVFSLEDAIDQLDRWDLGWAGGVVEYSFFVSTPDSVAGEPEYTGFNPFSEEQKEAVELILELLSSIAGITFIEVPATTSSDDRMTFANSTTLSEFSWGHCALSYYSLPGRDSIAQAEVWVNSDGSGDYNLGGYNFMALMHEIMHGLGLTHPGEYNANGEPITYEDHAEYAQDTYQYTVMSYFEEIYSGANFTGVYPWTPMLHDIAALQHIYGANTSARTGNTTYWEDSNAGDYYNATSRPVFTIWDGGGIDTLSIAGSSFGATLDLRQGAFSSTSSATNNIAIAFGTVIENAIGTNFVDTIRGNEVANRLEGLAGADTLNGAEGNDFLVGGADNDRLEGGDGTDTAVFSGNRSAYTIVQTPGGLWQVSGADGTDTLVSVEFAQFADQTVQIGAPTGPETWTGTSGADTKTGTAFADTLSGRDGADTISGAGGDDRIYGGNQNDTLNGDAGEDNIRGEAGNDVIDGGADDDIIYGGDGDDLIQGGLGADKAWGGIGVDTIRGGDGDDSIRAEDGNDQVYGDAGADFLYGDKGDDRLEGGLGTDVIYGGVGADTIYGGDDYDRAYGQDGDDKIWGGAGKDYLWGNDDNDSIRGEDGDDTLRGDNGDDFLYGGVGIDTLYGGEGLDRAYGGDGSDQMYGAGGDDRLYGEAHNDTIRGEAGADYLYGGDGNDFLYGGDGADRLDGGAGVDRMYGQAGADVFWFDDGHLSNQGAALRDRIHDFNAAEGDVIDLSAIDANVNLNGDQAFVKVNSFSGVAGQFVLLTSTGFVSAFFDIDGDGAADLALRVDGATDGVTGWVL